MTGRAASEVLALPVRLHGIQLGKPVDALLDPLADRLLGFEVRCGDDEHRSSSTGTATTRGACPSSATPSHGSARTARFTRPSMPHNG
jgi:hypothetical protein